MKEKRRTMNTDTRGAPVILAHFSVTEHDGMARRDDFLVTGGVPPRAAWKRLLAAGGRPTPMNAW